MKSSLKDQLCYQVDPNEYKDKIDLKGDLSLKLFIHFNEDRQMEDSNNLEEPYITIDTIGKAYWQAPGPLRSLF